MTHFASDDRAAHLVDPREIETFDVMGATIQLLALAGDGESAACIMQGTIPPGGVVPLHSHADFETFLAISGEAEGLSHTADTFRWVRIGPGDVFHVPGGSPHAFRNRSPEPFVAIIVSITAMGRFFRDVGTPVAPGTRPLGPPVRRDGAAFSRNRPEVWPLERRAGRKCEDRPAPAALRITSSQMTPRTLALSHGRGTAMMARAKPGSTKTMLPSGSPRMRSMAMP